MIQEAIAKITEGIGLTAGEAESTIAEVMAGKATPVQIAGLIVGLRVKGETVEEIQGAVMAMRAASVRITPRSFAVADTCGTGGDGKHTLNVSTGAALALAGAGIVVAKHGNRAVSSKAGSADVLEALGVKIDAAPPVVERCMNEAGICFCFAPTFHPAMRHAGPVRRELGVRTLFNILGPLANPAGAHFQIVGVSRPELMELVARVLARLGTRRSLVVHSADGLDELTTTASSRVIEVAGHEVKRRSTWNARSVGLRRARIAELVGGTAEQNADALLRILKGESGVFRDAVVYNAGAVCWLTGKAPTVRAGVKMASLSLDSGAALDKLERLKTLSRQEA